MRRGRSASRGTPASVPLPPRGGFSFATTTSRCQLTISLGSRRTRLCTRKRARCRASCSGGSRPWLDGRVPGDLIGSCRGSILISTRDVGRDPGAPAARAVDCDAVPARQSHLEGGLTMIARDGRALLPHANLRVGGVADPARLVARVAVPTRSWTATAWRRLRRRDGVSAGGHSRADGRAGAPPPRTQTWIARRAGARSSACLRSTTSSARAASSRG